MGTATRRAERNNNGSFPCPDPKTWSWSGPLSEMEIQDRSSRGRRRLLLVPSLHITYQTQYNSASSL